MASKTCFRCGTEKPLDDFYRHPKMADGRLGKCKECTKADVRSNAAKNAQRRRDYERERFRRPERKAQVRKSMAGMRERSPEKYAARNAVTNAVRDGRLTRLPCEDCGSERSEAHHEDYSKPLEVRWLCRYHHRIAHGQNPCPIASSLGTEPRSAEK